MLGGAKGLNVGKCHASERFLTHMQRKYCQANIGER